MANNKLRKAIISNGDNEVVKTIVEIVLNTIRGNHKVTYAHLNALKIYKIAIRFSPKHTINSKRKVLIQKGGFFYQF